MKGNQPHQQKSFQQLIFMALYKLSKLRCSQLFLSPVSTELYPDYLTIITSPIDIQTITNKFKAGNYSFISQIYEDLLLIGKNYFQYNKHEWSQQSNKTISRWIKSMDAGWNTLKKQLKELGYKEDNKICSGRQALQKIESIEEKLKLAYIKKIGKIKDNGYQNIQQRKGNIGEQQTSQTNSKRTKINCVPKINNNGEIIQKIQVYKSNPNPSQNSITNSNSRTGRLTRSKIIQNSNNYSFGIKNQYVGSIHQFDSSRSKTRSGSRSSTNFSPHHFSVEQNTNGKLTKKTKKLIKQLKDLTKEQKCTKRKEKSLKSDSKIGWSSHEDIIQQTILINKSRQKKPKKEVEKEQEIYPENQIEQNNNKITIQEYPQPSLISLVDENKKQEKAVESSEQNTETVGFRQQTQTYHRRSDTQTVQKVQSTFTISKSHHDEGDSYERRSQPAQHSKFDLQHHLQNSQTDYKEKYCKNIKPVQVTNKISIRFQYDEPENNLESKRPDENSQNDCEGQHSQPKTDKVSEKQNNLIKHKLKKYKLILKNCIKWIYMHMINFQPSLTCSDVQHVQYLKKTSDQNKQIQEQLEQCEECKKYKKQIQLLRQLKSLKSYQHLQLSINAQMHNLAKGSIKLKNILTLLKEMNLWVKFVLPAEGIQNRNSRKFNKLYGWRFRDQYQQIERSIIKGLQKIIQYKKLGPEFSVLLQQAIDEMKKQKQATAHQKRYKNKNVNNNNRKNYRRITRSCNKIAKQLLQPSSILNENSQTSYPKQSQSPSRCENPQASQINSEIQESKVDHQQFIKILAKDGVCKGFRVVINQEQCSKYQNIKKVNKNEKKKNKYSTNISNKYRNNTQNRGSDSSSHSQNQQEENQIEMLSNKSSRSGTQNKKQQASFQSQSETEHSSQEQDQFIPETRTKRYKYARLKSLTKPQRQYLQHQHDQLNKKQEIEQDQLFIAQYSLRSNVCVLQKYGSKLAFNWEATKRTIFGELPSVISF